MEKDISFRHGYRIAGNDPTNYKKYTPKQIVEWEVKHKQYRNALNKEKAPKLIRLAQLYEVELPADLKDV